MRDLLSLARKEARGCLRDRTFVVLLILVPIVLDVLLGAVFLPARTPQRIPFAVWDQDGTKDSRELVSHIRSNPAFDVRYFLTDIEEGKRLLSQRKIRGFMIIPGDFSRNISRREPADVIVYEDFTFLLPGRTLMKNLYKVESWYQKDRLDFYFREKGIMGSGSDFLSNPAVLTFRPLFNSSLEYTDFVLPGVLFAVLFQMMTLLGVTVFFMNRELYTERSKYDLLGVKTAVTFLLFLIPFAVTYGIFFPAFGLPRGGPFMMTLLFAVFSLSCIWMGMAVAAMTGDQVFGTSLIIICGAVGFTFSGYSWPYFLFPAALKKLVYVFPITPFLEEASKVFYRTGFPVHFWKMLVPAFAYLGLTAVFLKARELKGGRP